MLRVMYRGTKVVTIGYCVDNTVAKNEQKNCFRHKIKFKMFMAQSTYTGIFYALCQVHFDLARFECTDGRVSILYDRLSLYQCDHVITVV